MTATIHKARQTVIGHALDSPPQGLLTGTDTRQHLARLRVQNVLGGVCLRDGHGGLLILHHIRHHTTVRLHTAVQHDCVDQVCGVFRLLLVGGKHSFNAFGGFQRPAVVEVSTANSLFQLRLGVFQRLPSGVFQCNANQFRVLLGFPGNDAHILLP